MVGINIHIVSNHFCWKNIYSLCLTRILLWIPYKIIKGRYTVEMGSKHEITIHTEPLLFSLSYPQKRPSRITVHWKAPTSPTSCKSNSSWSSNTIFQSVVHWTMDRILSEIFFYFYVLFLTRRFIHRVAKIQSTIRRI